MSPRQIQFVALRNGSKKHFEMSLKVAVIDELNTKTSNDLQSLIHFLTLSNKMDYIHICIRVLASFNTNFVILNFLIKNSKHIFKLDFH